jgi:hypothetical protein
MCLSSSLITRGNAGGGGVKLSFASMGPYSAEEEEEEEEEEEGASVVGDGGIDVVGVGSVGLGPSG